LEARPQQQQPAIEQDTSVKEERKKRLATHRRRDTGAGGLFGSVASKALANVQEKRKKKERKAVRRRKRQSAAQEQKTQAVLRVLFPRAKKGGTIRRGGVGEEFRTDTSGKSESAISSQIKEGGGKKRSAEKKESIHNADIVKIKKG